MTVNLLLNSAGTSRLTMAVWAIVKLRHCQAYLFPNAHSLRTSAFSRASWTRARLFFVLFIYLFKADKLISSSIPIPLVHLLLLFELCHQATNKSRRFKTSSSDDVICLSCPFSRITSHARPAPYILIEGYEMCNRENDKRHM